MDFRHVAVGHGHLPVDALAAQRASKQMLPGVVVHHAGDRELDLLAAQAARAHQKVAPLRRREYVEYLELLRDVVAAGAAMLASDARLHAVRFGGHDPLLYSRRPADAGRLLR